MADKKKEETKKKYYVKGKESYLVRDYRYSDPGTTVIEQYAAKFTRKEAKEALEFCESFPYRKGVFKIIEVEPKNFFIENLKKEIVAKKKGKNYTVKFKKLSKPVVHYGTIKPTYDQTKRD